MKLTKLRTAMDLEFQQKLIQTTPCGAVIVIAQGVEYERTRATCLKILSIPRISLT